MIDSLHQKLNLVTGLEITKELQRKKEEMHKITDKNFHFSLDIFSFRLAKMQSVPTQSLKGCSRKT